MHNRLPDELPTRRKSKGPKRGRKKWMAWVAGLGVVGALAVGTWWKLDPTHALNTSRVSALNKNFALGQQRVTILLLGNALSIINGKDVTNPYVRDRTDAMMLVSVDTKTGQVSVLSVPRDSLVDIPHVGYTKLNEANYFGGPKLAVQEVENMLHIPVDFYLETTMWNFADIINQIGGLTLYVPKPMHYGGTGNYLDINLNQGWQHLNGQQVLEFARFRHEPMGSIARSFQQQEIIRAIMHKLLEPQNLPKLPSIALELRKDIVYTNLHNNQLIALALVARHVSLSQVQFATIPGTPTERMDPFMHVRLDYWVDNTKWERLLADQMMGQPWTAQQKKSIHFVVRSGTDTLTQAQQVASWLEKQGYTVNEVIWSNRHNHQHNEIVNFTGDEQFAKSLALKLGPASATIISNSPYHDVAHLDMIITIGQDFKPQFH
ncbi:LCP family protein [Sulfobacillus thermosulfidooxidans]|uniref:LCP family protein n=1 Tax=Sulfobacillus thermosulfidooxidans TaxID=28034 RepID=UPI00096BC9CE|nr:LCP family protein [Sulfobacillus thermosulfidooxidans]OLZ08366.1 transcriptional regulator [Sulfobacillus thermosulfidooxidans]OLZ13913.1 transcriptional regulator [Sulfobacillus thermosulfidooxidans]OLZ20531.1 transcriptional regulator [Sulfobacillus thermosulfidooxidans]